MVGCIKETVPMTHVRCYGTGKEKKRQEKENEYRSKRAGLRQHIGDLQLPFFVKKGPKGSVPLFNKRGGSLIQCLQCPLRLLTQRNTEIQFQRAGHVECDKSPIESLVLATLAQYE